MKELRDYRKEGLKEGGSAVERRKEGRKGEGEKRDRTKPLKKSRKNAQ